MVRLTSTFRLSGTIYRLLKRLGISPSPALFHQARTVIASKGKWGDIKVALLQEIETTKHSTQTTLFIRQLLERIESIEQDGVTNPLIEALFDNSAALPENLDSSVVPEIRVTGEFTDNQRHALELGRRSPISFLIGAPSTGKTRVTSQLISEYISAGQSTLLCCYTRDALNHAVSRLDEETRTSELFQGRTISAVVMDGSQAVVDNVVVDEAGMANLAHVLCLATLARHRILFVGDPMQLTPIAHAESDLARKWLKQNIFQLKAGSSNLSELYFWQTRNSACVLLREQFNVSDVIAPVLNQLAYFSTLSEESGGRGILSVVDTSALDTPLTGGWSSPINEGHAAIVATEVRQALTRASVEESLIGVLTPFNSQRKKLTDLFKEWDLSEDIVLGTIHTFQGQLKNCIVLDLTASGVDHTFRILSDENQALALLNSAFSRVRTRNRAEGRLIVVADYQHMREQYPESTVLRFLERIRSRADSLIEPRQIPGPSDSDDYATGNTYRFQEATARLIEELNGEYSDAITALDSDNLPAQESLKNLIWKFCDVIPRQLHLCNRLRKSGAPEYFRSTPGTRQQLEQLPLSALELTDLSTHRLYSPERAVHFRQVVSSLYVVLYESSMLRGADMVRKPPPQPIFDPDAVRGESYGRIRVWLRDMRNAYFHDIHDWENHRQEFNQAQVESFFLASISKAKPEHALDYLQSELFALNEAVGYLDAVRTKLKQLS